MPSNQYTKDFADYAAHNFPGQIVPEFFNHQESGGEANPGLQWMFQSGMSAYGPRHIIAGIEIQSGGTNSITGTAGYYMWNGQINEWSATSGTIAANYYAYLSGDGTLNTAPVAQFNSGLMVALSGSAGITNISQRWDANKLLYSYMDRLQASQISGQYISGEQITGTNGVIDTFNFTTASGSIITGTFGLIDDIKFTTASGSQITGTSGIVEDVISDVIHLNEQASIPPYETGMINFFVDDGVELCWVDQYGAKYIIDHVKGWDISTISGVQTIATQGGDTEGIFFSPDGLKMYEAAWNENLISESTLTTAWDLSTASLTQSIATQGSGIMGLFLNPNGLKMYEVETDGDLIHESTLTTAWDISTASFTQSISTQGSSPEVIFFSPDGLKMYEADDSTNLIHESTLTTAWDISSASLTQSGASQDENIQGLFFSPNGLKMYEIGFNTRLIYESTLTTAWDISTASLVQSVTGGASNPGDIFFSPDGLKLYQIDTGNDWIHELKLERTL